MSLADFCDLVWLEIWNDCSPMGDLSEYRRIVTELFIDGKDPHDITYEVTDYDGKGKPVKKMKRLSDTRGSKHGPSDEQMTQLRELQQKLKQGGRGRVTSSPDAAS